MSDMVMLRKNGYYYRPDARGYTASPLEAGQFPRAEAEAHVKNTEGVYIVEFDPSASMEGDQ